MSGAKIIQGLREAIAMTSEMDAAALGAPDLYDIMARALLQECQKAVSLTLAGPPDGETPTDECRRAMKAIVAALDKAGIMLVRMEARD